MADSVIAPTTATFAPGNDVVGLVVNTALPAELAAWVPYADQANVKVSSAEVTYNSHWSPTATTPQIKYTFVAFVGSNYQSGIIWGVAVCDNPSVSTVAKIVPQMRVGVGTGFDGTYTALGYEFYGANESESAPLVTLQDADYAGNALLGVNTALDYQMLSVFGSADSNGDGITGGLIRTWAVSSETGS